VCERRASPEKGDAQADPTTPSGKADTAGLRAKTSAQLLRRGSGDSMYTRKAYAHGRPQGVVRDDQPDAREGQAGRPGVAERFAVPRKPGNAGGGKGPQYVRDHARRVVQLRRSQKLLGRPERKHEVNACCRLKATAPPMASPDLRRRPQKISARCERVGKSWTPV
jgi:hypothetical protein